MPLLRFVLRKAILLSWASLMPSSSRASIATAGPQKLSKQAASVKLGSWQLDRVIGEGRMNRIYLAQPASRPVALKALYAVKCLRQEWEDDPAASALLCHEATVGSKISHPHVVPVLASGLRHKPYFLVMPHLTGSTLSHVLAAQGPLALSTALWITRQVAEGLEALQKTCDMMHADIKPSNIFRGPDGHVTLLDLGLSRKVDQTGPSTPRPVVGTLDYVAPEMISPNLTADVRSDIYSLGITLYEMLTGSLPFETSNPEELARLHRQGSPRPLRSLIPQLPGKVAQLVHQMLAKEPLRRPQTLRELIARLVRLEIDFFA